MKPSEVLEQYDWTMGTYARDNKSCPVSVFSESANSFCILGACRKAFLTYEEDEANRPTLAAFCMILKSLIKEKENMSISAANDHSFISKDTAIKYLKQTEEIYYKENDIQK